MHEDRYTSQREISSISHAEVRSGEYVARRIWRGLRRTLGDMTYLNSRLFEAPLPDGDEGVQRKNRRFDRVEDGAADSPTCAA
jgi:hypothetical protein